MADSSMQGLWWLGDNNSLKFREDISEPQIQNPNDVKIKVSYSGICGSDIHYMSGSMGKMGAKSNGVVMGHEFSGTIIEVGKESKFKVGDEVCVNPNNCCGKCVWSEDNLPQFCPNNIQVGVQSDGGWAQFCVVKDFLVSKLPGNVTLEQGALGEPYSCVMRGWRRLDPLPSKDARVLVQGAGIIGSLFCCLLHYNGFKNVTVTELNEERRNLCRGMKLQYDIIAPQELDLMFAKKDVDIDGFHLVIDCTGNTIAVKKALESARRGGKVLLFGCCAAGKTIPFEPYQLFWKELTVLGSFINPFCFEDTIELLGQLSTADYLNFDKLGIKLFSLDQYEEAFECLKKGKASKAMFKI